jgi:hypothetical protein
MAYKSLLTVAASSEGLLPVVTAAAQLATRLDAHLDAMALGVDRTQIGYSYVGSGAVMIAAGLERADQDARAAEKRALMGLSDELVQNLRPEIERLTSDLVQRTLQGVWDKRARIYQDI